MVKPDKGDAFLVVVPQGVPVLRAAPGASDIGAAVKLPFDWIVAGDRVLVRGVTGRELATPQASQVVVMARRDLDRKRDDERLDWRARGVPGIVTAIDPEKGAIIIRSGRRPDAPSVVVSTVAGAVVFRRYAPDSVRFDEARPSALAELKIGDELRALGDRGPDGTLLAEQVVFGSFRSALGRVVAIDPARSELTIRDEASRQPITVSVSPDARLRRLSPEAGGRAPAANAPEDLLDRLPAIALADLEIGERVLVSSAAGNDATRFHAIALVAGLGTSSLSPGAGRGSRGDESGLPAELMDFGMSLP
jgi:hypothetical protein